MTPPTVLAGGVLAALFVAVNVGGSSTGVSFGPATGSGVLAFVSLRVV
jgi:PiT family inorganic phosphate transporter